MQCDGVIRFVDFVVREILKRKKERIAEAEAESPSQKPTLDQFNAVMDKMKKLGFEGSMAITREVPDEIERGEGASR